MDGWQGWIPRPDDRREMVLYGYAIRRCEIPGYFTDDVLSALDLWQTYRIFGLPYAGGWAEQPARLMDVIRTIETEARRREMADAKVQQEKLKGKRK